LGTGRMWRLEGIDDTIYDAGIAFTLDIMYRADAIRKSSL